METKTSATCTVTTECEEDGIKVIRTNTDGRNKYVIHDNHGMLGYHFVSFNDEGLDILLDIIRRLRGEDCNGTRTQ